MSTPLELRSAQLNIEKSGYLGTLGLFPVVNNKIVTTTNMKLGAYTIAAQPIVPALLSVLVTAVTGNDTMGTITFVGTDIYDAPLTEVVIPIPGTTVCTTNMFKTVTSATGAGWVINTGNDTIIIGVASIVAPTGYYFNTLIVHAAAVVASMTTVPGCVCAPLNTFTSLPVGTYPIKATKIALTSGQAMVVLSRL
jgi:type IV secretory pathway protease TraF